MSQKILRVWYRSRTKSASKFAEIGYLRRDLTLSPEEHKAFFLHKIINQKNQPVTDRCSEIVGFGHDREPTRSRLKIISSFLLMRRWPNQLRQRSLH